MSSRSRQRAVQNDTRGPSTTANIDDATKWHIGRRGIQHEHLEQHGSLDSCPVPLQRTAERDVGQRSRCMCPQRHGHDAQCIDMAKCIAISISHGASVQTLVRTRVDGGLLRIVELLRAPLPHEDFPNSSRSSAEPGSITLAPRSFRLEMPRCG